MTATPMQSHTRIEHPRLYRSDPTRNAATTCATPRTTWTLFFQTWSSGGAGGLVISADAFFSSQSAQLAALALRHAVPTVSPYREFVTVGGLMSYGASITDLYRLVGVYVGRILNGIKPSELPVQALVKFELVINTKTAKALSLEIPPSLYLRAYEVIE